MNREEATAIFKKSLKNIKPEISNVPGLKFFIETIKSKKEDCVSFILDFQDLLKKYEFPDFLDSLKIEEAVKSDFEKMEKSEEIKQYNDSEKRLLNVLEEWSSLEPDFIEILEKIVKLKKNDDSLYSMTKNLIIKNLN